LKINKNPAEKITTDDGTEKAPEIIELKEHEKFRDDEGNIIEIETRGEREHDKIYFRVKDVSKGFGMERLRDTLIDENTKYVKNKHYIFFNCKIPQEMVKKTSIKKELFLTYEGILRVLFVSESGKTSRFIKWATKTLFTVQLGTQEQKINLFSSTLGIHSSAVKEFFNADASTLPCIYLFSLGYVKNLKESMKLDSSLEDDSIICKYGLTKDLKRRTTEHEKSYGSIKGSELYLKHYSYIDPVFLYTAETDLKSFMGALKLNCIYENKEELVVIPNNLSKIIEKQYMQLSKSYIGHVSELSSRIKELEDKNEKQELQHQNELLKSQKEIQELKHKHEILTKEYEYNLLKKELELMKAMRS